MKGDLSKTKSQLIEELKELREQAEKKVSLRERYFNTLMENMTDAFSIVDVDGTMRYFSDSLPRVLGYGPEEQVGDHFIEKIHPDDIAITNNYYELLLKERNSKVQFEVQALHKDGSWRWIEVEGKNLLGDSEIQGILVTFRDITERKHVERALRESEDKFRQFFDNAPDYCYMISLSGEILGVNKAALKVLGYKKNELVGKPLQTIYAPESIQKMEKVLRTWQKGATLKDEEMVIITKTGDKRIVLLSADRVIGEGGKILHSVSTQKDITEHKRAEEVNQTIIRTALDGFWMSNLTGRLLEVNDSFCQMIGYTREELLEMSIADIEAVEKPEETDRHIRKVLEQGSDRFETRHRCKDGRIIDVEVSVNHLEVGEGCQFVFIRDITERKQAEEERRKIERLESLGTLAGGIAHDFNNLLTGIMGNISLVKRYVRAGGKAAERLLEAEKASLRARDLTQQLLTFSKGGAPVKRIISIGRLVEEATSFSLRGSNVGSVFNLPDDLWAANADQGQITEVISNLVINANEAMPEGGTINISARNTTLRGSRALSLPRGDYVEVTIEDHGIGIPKEHINRIFEPYFTTKHRGSGLGLATAYSIIKNHDGNIAVDSKLGAGSTFRVYLPASKGPVSLEREESDELSVPGGGRILVMDDEEAIRQLIERALSDFGYEVALTADGDETVKQYIKAREAGHPFDAVILDLTVPGKMGGREAVQKLLEVDPDVRAIASSGYSTDPVIANFKKYGFADVVVKPYRIAELRGTLHNVLKKPVR